MQPPGRLGVQACAAAGQARHEDERVRAALAAGDGDDARPAKRARKAKPYVPQVGTANYAFLVLLYVVGGPPQGGGAGAAPTRPP
jgi:hypothetical protein